MDPFTIFATIMGGAVGLMAYFSSFGQGMESMNDQLHNTERKKKQALAELDLDWSMAVEEAIKKADYQDKNLDNAERTNTDTINGNFRAAKLQQEAEANAWNNQAMRDSSETGNALSQSAANGTRTSSMQQAIDLQSAVNAQNLQITEDMQRNQDSIGLANMFGALNDTVNSIQYNRQVTDQLRKDYSQGGKKYQMYQLKREGVEGDYNAALMSQRKEINNAYGNMLWGALSAAFTGGQTGYKFKTNLDDFISDWGWDDLKPDITFNNVNNIADKSMTVGQNIFNKGMENFKRKQNILMSYQAQQDYLNTPNWR